MLEDHARFVSGHTELTAAIREVRHGITRALSETGIPPLTLLGARDTPGDIGTRPGGPDLARDATPDAVLGAAAGRAAEALRSLEETCAACGLASASAVMASLRYSVYDLEKRVRLGGRADRRVHPLGPRVYFLWDLDACPGDPLEVLAGALAGGAAWVQLRAKRMAARRVLELGRAARMKTLACGAVLIVNDRADLAQLVGADGVHCGQSDLQASQLRRLLGQNAILGGTTHSLADIQREMTEPLDYVGFGPIGSTTTKEGALPPLGVQAYAALPETHRRRAIPIGGIDAELAAELAGAGAMQVCVGSAIFGAKDPAAATRAVLEAMRAAVAAE